MTTSDELAAEREHARSVFNRPDGARAVGRTEPSATAEEMRHTLPVLETTDGPTPFERLMRRPETTQENE